MVQRQARGGGGNPHSRWKLNDHNSDLRVSGTSATYGSSVAAESYTLSLTAQNGSKVVASTVMESAPVHPGLTANWAANLSDGTQRLGSVKGTSHTVALTVPFSTDVTTFTTTGASAAVGSTTQISGTAFTASSAVTASITV